MTVLSHRRLDRLLKVARALHVDTSEDARGRCLSLSLELAWMASRQGTAVNLVTWRVNDDDHFFDHWAVVIGKSKVIDLTRVQVDGRKELIHDLTNYPANFVCPRFYPAALLLPEYDKSRGNNTYRLPPRFVWKMRKSILGQELGHALHRRRFLHGVQAVLEFGRFCLVHSLDHWLGRVQARRDKLSEEPYVSKLMDGKKSKNLLQAGFSIEMLHTSVAEFPVFLLSHF